MPTYAHECRKCGHAFERFKNMSDPPAEKCPSCGGDAERVIAPGAGIIAKASDAACKTCNERSPCTTEAPCRGRADRCERSR